MTQKFFSIEQLSWQSPKQSMLKALREQVFIVEQSVPKYIEWDEYDDNAIHLLASDDAQQAIGCARILLERGRVGRMGVLKQARGQGVGYALLMEAIAICKAHGLKQLQLSSQTHAIQFYEKAGFVVTSDAYIDANIWHKDMVFKWA
ncbi:MAG: GNAT family N-acetyltransferase [Methylophilaceae bacterium 17-44-8]|jgi:predicted GNAT family N-acyltransferase|nr:MAG: GNAT family N-acetyltransferase [Methylophilales bacterium 28-44-11]OYZ03833.1 MAG: GNAT family N-acetyltransferase [Methylophilales bacterium 16-45-7]OZA06324.1 MAG: GNAT family N-acetyltransferase [Methylophilaceae bacterium 17-44-8]